MTDLAAFIASPARSEWIVDSGLHYYVRKSWFFPGLIELASCAALNDTGLNYWRFTKRHAATIPFLAEQVLNVGLARFYERCGWLGRDGGGGVPHYLSPLAVERYGTTERFHAMGWSRANRSDYLAAMLAGCEA